MVKSSIKPIMVSFKDNEQDRKLEKFIRSKSGYATWIKEQLYKIMERELAEANQQSNQQQVQQIQRQMPTVPKYKDDFM